jgi:hypothetical protein
MTTPGHAEPGRFRGETLPDLLGPHTWPDDGYTSVPFAEDVELSMCAG